MGRQLVLISLLAGAVAVLVGIGVYLLGPTGQSAPGPARVDLATVLVARERIPVGTRLTRDLLESDVREDRWPAEHLPEQAVTSRDAVANFRVKATIYPGEPIFEFKLASPDGRGSLPMLIDDGMRAFTVRVDDVTGVSGFLVPESYVDVIGTFKNVRHPVFGERRGATFSRTILEYAKVLASGRQIDEDGGERDESRRQTRPGQGATTVTLLVTPAQAEVLALAEQEGTIHLALRSYEDEHVVGTPGITRDELLGLPPIEEPVPTVAAVDPEPESEPGIRVEVIKGGERSAVTF